MSKTLKYNDYSLTYDEYLLGYENVNGTVKNKHDYSKDYLTFEALEDGTFTFTMTNKLTTQCVSDISYSLDNGKTWTTTSNIDDQEIIVTTPTITSGNKVLWKANAVLFCTNADPYPGGNIGYGSYSSSGNYSVSGNIMSLLYNDNFNDQTDFPNLITTGVHAGHFAYLLGKNNNKLIHAKNLILPATALSGNYCYFSIFKDCTNLITAPKLPATTLTTYCYGSMFSGCSSLTTAPELPATTLSDYCYGNMFSGCTALITAPTLLATILADSCYSSMFYGCTSLTTAPELPATTLVNNCYFGMFEGCTSLTTAPKLPATTLTQFCYNGMFISCSNLNKIIMLATDISAYNCLNEWVNGVSPTGTFIKNSAAEWDVTGVNGIPEGWTVIESNE